jgi:hypothetical protein
VLNFCCDFKIHCCCEFISADILKHTGVPICLTELRQVCYLLYFDNLLHYCFIQELISYQGLLTKLGNPIFGFENDHWLQHLQTDS